MIRARAITTAAIAALALSISISAGSCGLIAGLDGLEFTSGSGGGPSTTCTSDAQCDDRNACTADTCTADGLCAFDPVSDGIAPSGQIAGDCKTAFCAGGVAHDEDDDADVPSDDEDCTVDTCTAGTPAHTAVPNGTPCIAGTQPGSCTSGMCEAGDCTDDDPCPDPGPCATTTCDVTTGMCLVTPLPDGSPTPGVVEMAGDCRVHVCKNGADVHRVDDSDVPITATDCDSEICNGQMPSNPPLDAGTPCSTSPKIAGYCDGVGACVECTNDAQCAGVTDDCKHPVCVANVCGIAFTQAGTLLTSQVPGDCQLLQCDGAGGFTSVVDDTDKPNDGRECTNDVCTAGVPSNPPLAAQTPCNGGAYQCNATGDCGCQSNGDCVAPNTCGGGNPGTAFVCGCTKTTCAIQAKTCGIISDACFATLNCNGAKNGLETDVDCGGPIAGCAARCAQGKACTAATDCASGFCVDGFCCNTACTLLCNACSAVKKGQGQNGVCGAIKTGSDPDNECPVVSAMTCGTDGFCDGASACRKFVAGTQCAAPTCSQGVQTNADTCNGNGTCVDNGTLACGLYNCNGAGTACRVACIPDTDCIPTAYCDAALCVPKKGPMANCLTNHECLSNVCIVATMKCQ